MPHSDLATVYAPVLKEISNGLAFVQLSQDEGARVRELIIELKAIYDRAANRES